MIIRISNLAPNAAGHKPSAKVNAAASHRAANAKNMGLKLAVVSAKKPLSAHMKLSSLL